MGLKGAVANMALRPPKVPRHKGNAKPHVREGNVEPHDLKDKKCVLHCFFWGVGLFFYATHPLEERLPPDGAKNLEKRKSVECGVSST